ncbi:MAG: DUF871 family protein [Eubacterium sp.]|nr:DUF871 family protein [Eubacterium sp.]
MKKRLGISLYPEYASDEQCMAYLETASNYGFSVLFLALLGIGKEKDCQAALCRYQRITSHAKKLGYEICADVNPMVFHTLGVNARFFEAPLDLGLFSKLQIDILRLDLGMSDLEEAYLSKNQEKIKICLNGASKNDHIGNVLGAGADAQMLLGCCNYYPHRYTGMSLPSFEQGAANWKKYNLRLMAFVSSNEPGAFGPWPVTEGLPTLEMHRDWNIRVQTKHYLLMDTVDDIMIGNCFASKEELSSMAEEAAAEKITFRARLAEGLPENMKQRLQMHLSVRGDQGEYLIRSLESRMLRTEVEPFHTVDIRPGDLLVDNKLYGQYAGEVQIALKDMKNSGKTNVVGHIHEEELALLPYLKGGQAFGFQFI